MSLLFKYILGSSLKKIVFRVLALLGIGLVTFTGGSAVIGQLSSAVANQFIGLPPQIGQTLGILNIDKFMSIILSAFVIKIGIQSTLGGSKKLKVR